MHRSCSGGRYQSRILIAMAAALIPMIAGCEAGQNAPSLHWHQPTDGTGAVVGNITISNVFVLGAPIGAVLKPGQNAAMFFGLVNTGTPDRLLSVAVPGVARSVLMPGGQVTLRSQQAVLLTGPRPSVVLTDLLRPVAGGSVVTVVLTFQNAGIVRLKVPVMPQAQYYTTLSQPASPTPSATKKKSPSPGASSNSRPSASPSAAPSPSPSSTP